MENQIVVEMERTEGYEFKVRFDPRFPELLMDEPAPLGADHGPSASRVLAAAVGNCLSASLLFCLTKSRVEVHGLRTRVSAEMERNERGRLRIARSKVRIEIDSPEEPHRLERCLGLFEDFCVVTQSVRQGIPVDVEVVDPAGAVLHSVVG